MGFGLGYEIIDGKPVLFEVLHETEHEVLSVIISACNGDKLQSIEFDPEKITAEIYPNGYSCKSTKIVAAIPIKIGDIICRSTLDKITNNLTSNSVPIMFIENGCASGPSQGDILSVIFDDIGELVKTTQLKSADDIHGRNHISSAVMITMFNVINPRNALSYHLPA